MQYASCSTARSPHPPAWRHAVVRAAIASALALAIVFGPAVARAQEGIVAGIVVGGSSEEPVPGAQVLVDGTGRGAVTGPAGMFRITGLTGTSVTLTVRRLGYRPASRSVQVGDENIRIALVESAVELNKVVVTGTAAGTDRLREIGNSVATVDAADVVDKSAAQSMQQLLSGRAPGVFVAPSTGQVGGGQRIRVRGQTTFSLPADPLIYVDGVRVNNEAATGISIQGFGSGAVSRMNDINPEDIESIEIIKGPAAATLYGTEASRGVINIITKRGSGSGRTTYSASVRQGAQWFHDPEGRLPINYWRDPSGTIQSLNLYAREKALGNEIWRTGRQQGYTLSVSGGTGNAHYFVSGDVDRDQGIDPTNEKDQFSGRANVTITPSEKVDVSVSTGYTLNDIDLACEAGCGGRTWGVLFSSPALLAENCAPNAPFGCGITRGWQSWPNEPYDIWNVFQKVHRFTGSVTANWRPLTWLTNRFTVGRDLTQERNTEWLPHLTNDTLRFFWGPRWANGYRFENMREVVFDTYDYSGTAKFDVRPELSSASSIGVQYYTKLVQLNSVQGEGFPAPGVETVEAAALKTFQTQDFFDNKTLGFYAQQQLGWRDRLFVTAGLRVDNNSAFGADVDFVTYPKAMVSWVLSEEPFFERYQPAWLNTLRFRSAFGESGQQPSTFAAVRTFSPVSGPGGTSAVTPSTIGNPTLKPERGRELEVGFDAGFLEERLGLDFTYYHTRTKDAILLQPSPPSGGFPGSRFVNAGEILNTGIEAQLRATVISQPRLGWDVTFNVATNSGEVKKLTGDDTTIVAGSVQHRIGYPAWSWFRERVVSADFDPVTGRAVNVMCDDGRGGSTPCFSATGAMIAPRVYLGRTTPSTEGALSSTLRFLEHFRLYGMLDFKTGFKKWDNNLRIRCQIFYTCLENIEPEKYDPRIIAQMQTSGTLVDFVIDDASFARLRELAFGIDVPQRFAQMIGGSTASVNFALRNIHTWTSYTGLDPEVMFLGGSITFEFEQNQIPHPRQFITTVNVTF